MRYIIEHYITYSPYMKIITYSDLHLEFGTRFRPPEDSVADVMILAGDIITFRDFNPLSHPLAKWKKPVLFVAGNHEYYRGKPIEQDNTRFKDWLAVHHPNVIFLQNESVEIDGVQFFGGTMWTNFSGGNKRAMEFARRKMNDYKYIYAEENRLLEPEDTIAFHAAFVRKLEAWFKKKPITST